jgi:PAS domain S-box-containing protein
MDSGSRWDSIRRGDNMELEPSLINQAPDAMIFADLEGAIREWNPAAERIFGYTSEEALGKSLDLIVPEKFRKAHWAGYERALAAGETKYRGQVLPTRSVRKDGTTIYVELSFAIIKDAHDTVIGALSHARDITERWAEERERRQRLQELERQLADGPGT